MRIGLLSFVGLSIVGLSVVRLANMNFDDPTNYSKLCRTIDCRTIRCRTISLLPYIVDKTTGAMYDHIRRWNPLIIQYTHTHYTFFIKDGKNKQSSQNLILTFFRDHRFFNIFSEQLFRTAPSAYPIKHSFAFGNHSR